MQHRPLKWFKVLVEIYLGIKCDLRIAAPLEACGQFLITIHLFVAGWCGSWNNYRTHSAEAEKDEALFGAICSVLRVTFSCRFCAKEQCVPIVAEGEYLPKHKKIHPRKLCTATHRNKISSKRSCAQRCIIIKPSLKVLELDWYRC